MQNYAGAWKSYDRASIADLFSDDASYRYHPYDDPIRGRESIVESWLEDPDAPGTYEGDYEPIAVEGDVAVAVGSSTYRLEDEPEVRVYDNCFLMRFDDEGRCREFTEWYMRRPKTQVP
ncbi:MAG: YybH family protein [Actinomycetota bacterium]